MKMMAVHSLSHSVRLHVALTAGTTELLSSQTHHDLSSPVGKCEMQNMTSNPPE